MIAIDPKDNLKVKYKFLTRSCLLVISTFIDAIFSVFRQDKLSYSSYIPHGLEAHRPVVILLH
jgi:hypothetical protein